MAEIPGRRANGMSAPRAGRMRVSSWWTVACVAVANGSDNLAVYVPLYASHADGERALITLIFVGMVGIGCAGAVWLVEHPVLGAPIRRYGTALLPFILLAIGVSVILQNDTPRIVFGL
jgi:cadmium resistance protein CadD (predicted permease)